MHNVSKRQLWVQLCVGSCLLVLAWPMWASTVDPSDISPGVDVPPLSPPEPPGTDGGGSNLPGSTNEPNQTGRFGDHMSELTDELRSLNQNLPAFMGELRRLVRIANKTELHLGRVAESASQLNPVITREWEATNRLVGDGLKVADSGVKVIETFPEDLDKNLGPYLSPQAVWTGGVLFGVGLLTVPVFFWGVFKFIKKCRRTPRSVGYSQDLV